MPEIVHVTARSAWEAALSEGAYRGDSLSTEGFLHCCLAEQLPGVLGRYFRGRSGLVALRIDSARLSAPLLWECPPGSTEDFPHLYGPLNVDAVVGVEAIAAPEAGRTES